jgi:signal transduction histidine kinase/ActR/RegA family two-component response regulator
MCRTLATRLPQRIETVIVRGASEERHLVVDARPNASDSGVEVVLAMTDVTALREAERARRDLEQRAMQSEKVETVARVAASVAHDVNNLLAAVTSIAEYARDVGSATPADLGAILDACQRGSRLMRALLGMANVSSAPPRTVNVVRIAQSVAAVLMRSRTARVRLDLPAQPLLVRGNEDAFYQSLFNVCVNGIDAMSGEGELRVCLGLSPNGDRVVVRVIDQGAGIPPEIQSRVFEPLFTTRAHTGGTGLGLAIAQRALTRYGATIELRSTVGVGTEVELTFERVDEAVKPEVASAPCNIAGVSVLFVDDDDRVRTAMGRVLRAMRCRVQEHGEGSAALATLGAERTFDVALVDVNMPDMSGAELARVLFDRYGPFPLVFVTGATGEIVPAAMLARAFVGMVRKPCTGAELAEAIHAALAAAPLAERVLSRRAEAV